jgi:isoamylase
MQGDRPLRLPMQDLVIYEAHVRGFTQDETARRHMRTHGTYRGMAERLDYLQTLGITAIELLPIFEFNELEYYTPIPGTDLYRYNFWGYSTVAFFAPMSRYASDVRPRFC